MTKLSIVGGMSLKAFSVIVPQAGQPPLEIKNLRGELPIRHSIDLKTLVPVSVVAKVPDSSDVLKPEAVSEKVAEAPDQLGLELEGYLSRLEQSQVHDPQPLAARDFAAARSFRKRNNPLAVDEISIRHLTLRNLEFDIEFRNNWLLVNQMLIEFLDGQIQASLQLALNPGPALLRAAVHFTRLDTRRLLEQFPQLKENISDRSLFTDPYLDGALHLSYNLQQDDLDGGLDITSIGEEQLRMILYYVDPEQVNPTIREIRSALSFGELRRVTMPIKNGFMGLTVDVRLLKVPIPTPALTRFPVAQLLANFKSGRVKPI